MPYGGGMEGVNIEGDDGAPRGGAGGARQGRVSAGRWLALRCNLFGM